MASMSVLTGHEQASGKNLTLVEEAFSTHMNHYASLSLLFPSHMYVPPLLEHTHTHTPPHSPDGQYVAAGSNDGTLFVWETFTGKVKSRKEHR